MKLYNYVDPQKSIHLSRLWRVLPGLSILFRLVKVDEHSVLNGLNDASAVK